MASSLGSLPACLPRSPTPEPPRGPSSSSAPLRVTVGKWRREGGVVAYEVSVAVGEEQWTVWKRFSDFRSLHSLCAHTLRLPPFALPRLLLHTKSRRKRRSFMLQGYLQDTLGRAVDTACSAGGSGLPLLLAGFLGLGPSAAAVVTLDGRTPAPPPLSLASTASAAASASLPLARALPAPAAPFPPAAAWWHGLGSWVLKKLTGGVATIGPSGEMLVERVSLDAPLLEWAVQRMLCGVPLPMRILSARVDKIEVRVVRGDVQVSCTRLRLVLADED